MIKKTGVVDCVISRDGSVPSVCWYQDGFIENHDDALQSPFCLSAYVTMGKLRVLKITLNLEKVLTFILYF